MKERPIIFSGSMVRAILEGRKSVTRRLVKPIGCINVDGGGTPFTQRWDEGEQVNWRRDVPRPCDVGDRLWVRETFRLVAFEHVDGNVSCAVDYRAGENTDLNPRLRGGVELFDERTDWRPSIFMPRWASRITLEVTGVRVERLQDISEEDARAEGLQLPPAVVTTAPDAGRKAFARLWDRINGKRAPWASNPWVWVLEFKRVQP